MTTSLFSRSPAEAYEHLERTLTTERLVRKRMRELNPEEFDYWSKQLVIIDAAIESLEVLRPS